MEYILSLDQGTTSSRAAIMDKTGKIISQVNVEFKQYYPAAGWVEHNPDEIWESMLKAIERVLKKANIKGNNIAAIGITNQRETTILWNKEGKPYYNAIVWQCRRTAPICEKLKKQGFEEKIRDKTGLVIDAYFSGTKIKWLLDNVKGLREKAKRKEVFFGTVDCFLLYKLTSGKSHKTDLSNASRTLICNIKKLQWDDEILDILGIPKEILPELSNSSGILGHTKGVPNLPDGIPIAGILGDQQAALFGQVCFNKGMAKCTYGTGAFLLVNTDKLVKSKSGLLTTIAWKIGNEVSYALEGSCFIAGAAIQWLRDELKLITASSQSEKFALSVKDSGGVYVVPAFVGLGAPHWDMYARGGIFGITRGTNRNHIIRATLESIAYQVNDLILVMEKEMGSKIKVLKVDGGASQNNFLMQFQADLSKLKVTRPSQTETTVIGAGFSAGLAVGFFSSKKEIEKLPEISNVYSPKINDKKRAELLLGWKRAVERVKGWAK